MLPVSIIAGEFPVKITVLVALVTLAACASQPPAGSLNQLKQDQRALLRKECVRTPDRFGFPYTRAENADLLSTLPQYTMNVDGYCRRVAQHLVR